MEPPNLTAAALLAKWQHVLDKTFDIFSWTSPSELCWLADCASRADWICEVGSYHAKSTKVMALADPEASIYCIDKPESARCQKIRDANLFEMSGIDMHNGTTANATWWPDSKFFFAFIDGGHLFEDVSGDIANLLPHMAPGAILSGHDWRHHDMNDGVNRGVLAHFKLEQLRFWESIWFVKLP